MVPAVTVGFDVDCSDPRTDDHSQLCAQQVDVARRLQPVGSFDVAVHYRTVAADARGHAAAGEAGGALGGGPGSPGVFKRRGKSFSLWRFYNIL